MYIAIAIILFGFLIGIHEFGHFIAAKSSGVKVNEFSIGMGPALVKKQGKETLYSLRALPIGGFCAMEGEDEASDNPRALKNQSFFKSFIILFAGSGMNFLLGFLLLFFIFLNIGGYQTPRITSFMENCPYESEAAFKKDDIIYSIDSHRILVADNISAYLKQGNGRYDIVLLRNGDKVQLRDFEMKPVKYEDGMFYGFRFEEYESSPLRILKHSLLTAIDFVREIWRALRDLIAGRLGLNMMAGPIYIVKVISDAGKSSGSFSDALINILYLIAFISVNLAVMNLLPIPALDGGRIFLLAINSAVGLISGRKVDSEYEKYIHAGGMILLLLFMAVIMFFDLQRLIKT